MGNRLEENCCIKCGNPLIEETPNSLHTCPTCTERVRKLAYDAISDRKNNVENKPRKIIHMGMLKKP